MGKYPSNNSGFPPEIIRFIGKKWVIQILKEGRTNKQIRFGELKKKFGITPKVLSEILGEMKDLGLIKKETKKSFPPAVIYRLSNRGLKLLESMKIIEEFSKKPTEIVYVGNSFDRKKIKKFLILLAIEKSILMMGKPELKIIEERLLADFNCTLEDCVSNPSPLKKVLRKMFGNCYDDILDIMQQSLKNSDDEHTEQFLEFMKMK